MFLNIIFDMILHFHTLTPTAAITITPKISTRVGVHLVCVRMCMSVCVCVMHYVLR